VTGGLARSKALVDKTAERNASNLGLTAEVFGYAPFNQHGGL
jgi:hypothetical protein